MGGIVDVGLDLTGCLIWVNWFKKEGGVLFCTFSFGVVNGERHDYVSARGGAGI